MLTLYDAGRCPYCARVRIVLAEKSIPYETVEIDLGDRPAWLYAKNPLGKVPVLEEDGGFVLPESQVIMEYLEDRYLEPALWPPDAAERALGRLWVDRFEGFADEYYALRRGDEDARDRVSAKLAELDRALEGSAFLSGREYGLADIGYVPWIARARSNLGVELGSLPSLAAWFERLSERPAVAAELELVASLA